MARTDRMSSAHATTYLVHRARGLAHRGRRPSHRARGRRSAAGPGGAFTPSDGGLPEPVRRGPRTKRRLVATAGSTSARNRPRVHPRDRARRVRLCLLRADSPHAPRTPPWRPSPPTSQPTSVPVFGSPAAVARARSHSRTRIAGDVAAAQTIYHGETQGPKLLEQLGRLARDPVLLSALGQGLFFTAAQAEPPTRSSTARSTTPRT